MQVPIPDDWDKESFCRWSVCWPDSPQYKAILYGLLESPMQGRFWDFDTGNFLDHRELFRPAYDYNFELKGVIMACEDPGIADALQAIADAIAQNGLGSGSSTINQNINCCEETIINVGGGAQGSVPGDENTGDTPIYGSEPPGGIPPGEVPDGYPDLETYQQDKCEMANLMVDNIIAQLRGFSLLPLVNSAALAGLIAAGVFGLIILPVTIIPTIVVMMIILGTSAFLLDQFADYIVSVREDFVCALYEADAADAAITTVAALIETGIAFLNVTGPLAVALKAIAMALFNTDTINQLFRYTAHAIYEGADCSGCASLLDCFDFEVEQDLLGWTVTDEAGGTVDLSIVAEGMEVVTGSPSDVVHTVFSSPFVDYTIQDGDQFIILYTSDPVPYGRILWLTLDSVRTQIIAESTIVDHLVCAPVDLSAYAGQVVSDIELSINRFGGGTWVIRRAGFNCECP